MPRLKYAARALALLLIAGCSEPTAPARAPVEGAQRVIADAGHGGPAHFYFLPPTVKQGPSSFPGTFDGALQPTVTVCELAGPVCGATVATFTTAGHGSDVVRVDGQTYKVNFHSGSYGLSTSKQYRITVTVGSVVVGYADAVVVKSGGDRNDVDASQFVVIKNGSTLPIVFRIEKGIAGAVVVSPAADTVTVGQTAQFTATVTDLHGVVIPGAAVTWSSQPATVATVDANGLATGVSVGSATITATSGTASGSASLEVLTANHPPVAVSDTFQAIGNVTVPVAAPGVLAHDSDPDGNSLSVVPGTVTTAQGGTVTFAADGSFSYLSAPGFTGTDSVAYVLSDGSAADTAQAVFNVASRVWYVRNTGPAPGDGRDASPFATLAQAQAASAPGETIFVLFGDASTNGVDAGIALKAGQSLIGQGISSPVTVTLNGQTVTLLAPGAVPTVGRTSPGAAVSLATNNTVRGVFVSAGAGAGFEGDGLGTLTISESSVSASGGPGADLRNGVLSVALGSLSSSASTTAGLYLAGVSGSFVANAGSIAGAAAAGVQLAGGSADVAYGGSVDAVTGRSVAITGRTGGTATLSGDISDHAAGILVQSNSGGLVEFTGASKTLATGGANAVTLSGNTGSSVRFAGGGLAINTTTGNGFVAAGGGSITVTGAGNTISSAGGAALSVTSTTIGAGGLTFQSISASGGQVGISLDHTGPTSGLLVTGTGPAGSGGTITNTAVAGISLSDVAAAELHAISLSNANLTDGGGAGVCDAVTNAGCNGAIKLVNARAVILDHIQISGTAEEGITGRNVTGLTLSNSSISGAGNAAGESGVYLAGLLGTANAITSTAVSGSAAHGVVIRNATATNAAPGAPDRLLVSGLTIGTSGTALPSNAFSVVLRSGANFDLSVAGSGFSGASLACVDVDVAGGSTVHLAVTGSTATGCNTGIQLGGAGGAHGTFDLSANPSIAAAAGNGISVTAVGAAALRGTISGNTLAAGSASNSGSGIETFSDVAGTLVADIAGNSVSGYSTAIRGGSRGTGSGSADLTLRNNTASAGGSFPFSAIWIFSGNGSAGEANRVCLDLSGNDASTASPFDTDYFLEQYAGNTFQIHGLTGSGTNEANVEAFVSSRDVGGASVNAFGGAVVNYTAGTCATP